MTFCSKLQCNTSTTHEMTSKTTEEPNSIKEKLNTNQIIAQKFLQKHINKNKNSNEKLLWFPSPTLLQFRCFNSIIQTKFHQKLISPQGVNIIFSNKWRTKVYSRVIWQFWHTMHQNVATHIQLIEHQDMILIWTINVATRKKKHESLFFFDK